jgi:hypothetical protein
MSVNKNRVAFIDSFIEQAKGNSYLFGATDSKE